MPETDHPGRRVDVRARGRRRLAGATAGLAAAGVVGTGVLAYSAHAADVSAGTIRSIPGASVSSDPAGSGNGTAGAGGSDSNRSTMQPPTATDQPPVTTSSGS